MPIPIDLCDPAAVLCCEALIDDGDLILAALQAALFECHGYDPDVDECAPPFQVFMSWGPPAVAYQDYLTAWVESVFRVTPQQATKGIVMPSEYRVTWAVRLSESGFPTFEGNLSGGINNPSLDAIDSISRVLISFGTKMVAAVSNLGIDGCKWMSVESMTPAVGGGEVLGGSAGVAMRLSYVRTI